MASPAEGTNKAKIGWQKLNLNQNMIIIVTIIMFLVALGLLIYWILRPPYAVLFQNLSLDDASAIVAKTDKLSVDAQENYTKTQLGMKDVYESSLERSIESMLAKVLGSENNAVVRVSAEIDFTETEIQINKVERGEEPVVKSEQVEKESYQGQWSSPRGAPSGTYRAPEPRADSGKGSTAYPQINAGKGNVTHEFTKKSTDYEFTRINEHKIKPPGTVKKLSVAVVVNNDGRNSALNDTIEDLVAAAAGIDKSRGDVLTVSSIPFNEKLIKKEEKAIADAQKREAYTNYGKYAVISIIFIIGLFALFKIASNFKPARQPEEFTPKPISGLGLKDEGIGDVDISDPALDRGGGLRLRHKERWLTKLEIQNLAKERPGDFAQLLRVWLNT
ncbi:MAG: hypothetical protein IBX64_00375 [Actinobacteria bacterium]|nr:hypothetical protein [Actinomycetota bacterium]